MAIVDLCSTEWNYALMSGLKTILTMAGAEDLSENDIPALWSKARGAKTCTPHREVYLHYITGTGTCREGM